jgi:hypothetical protein
MPTFTFAAVSTENSKYHFTRKLKNFVNFRVRLKSCNIEGSLMNRPCRHYCLYQIYVYLSNACPRLNSCGYFGHFCVVNQDNGYTCKEKDFCSRGINSEETIGQKKANTKIRPMGKNAIKVYYRLPIRHIYFYRHFIHPDNLTLQNFS